MQYVDNFEWVFLLLRCGAPEGALPYKLYNALLDSMILI